MENRNGQGIFLGVVGVATLVVAIIGATFAYFTAQIEGDKPVEAESYVFSAGIAVSEVSVNSDEKPGLIPMATADVVKAVNHTPVCQDTRGYEACQLYAVTFTNSGSGPIKLNGVLTVTGNDYLENHLKLSQFGTGTSYELGALPSPTSTVSLPIAGSDVMTVNLEEITVPTEGKTIYLAVHLEEMADANKDDQGKTFSGKLTYTATTGQTLTAQFNGQ